MNILGLTERIYSDHPLLIDRQDADYTRYQSRYALQCKNISHWLGAYLDWSLLHWSQFMSKSIGCINKGQQSAQSRGLSEKVQIRFSLDTLTHWGTDKMAMVLDTTFSIHFFNGNCFIWFKFNWNLFPRNQLAISQHWFRYWFGVEELTNLNLSQWQPCLPTHICFIWRYISMSWVDKRYFELPFLTLLRALCFDDGQVPFGAMSSAGTVMTKLDSCIHARTPLQFVTYYMTKSSNGKIFRVTGPFCKEFTSHQ